MKYQFTIKEISKDTALEMVQSYHYSNTLPRLNKHFVGFFLDERLVGMVTLGWGTRPLHTIKKLFPSLDTEDYFEIGRMCMTEDMPNGSESQMMSALCKWIKQEFPEIKVLFTWADGMLGKPGYVYQASGFIYSGFIWTDTYFQNGVKIHPRKVMKLFEENGIKPKNTRPTVEQMLSKNIKHYKGKQFKYFRFLCSKAEKKRLLKECKADLSCPYPKDNDLKWRLLDFSIGEWVESDIPPYQTDLVDTSAGF